MSDKRLGITLHAQVADLRKAVDELKSGMREVEQTGKETGQKLAEHYREGLETIRNYSGIAFAALTTAIGFSVREAAQGQTAMTNFRSAVRNAGGDSDALATKLDKTATRLQRLTGIADDQFMEAAARMTDMTKDAAGSIENLGLVADFSAARKIDLATASDAVGRAMMGETGRLAMLIPGLNDELQALGETASAAERKAVIMDRLAQYTGRAEDAAKTIAGQLRIAKEELAATSEQIGNAFIPMIQNATNLIVPLLQATGEWIKHNQDVVSALGAAGLAVTGFTTVIVGLTLAIKGLQVAILTIPGWGWALGGATAVAGLVAGLVMTSTEASKTSKEIRSFRQEIELLKEIFPNNSPIITITIGGDSKELIKLIKDLSVDTTPQLLAKKTQLQQLLNSADSAVRGFAISELEQINKQIEELARISGRGTTINIAKPVLASIVPQVEEFIPQETLDAMPGRMSAAMLATREVYQREMDELNSYDAKVWLTGLDNFKASLTEREAAILQHSQFLQQTFDAAWNSIANTEMTGKQRREMIWRQMTGSFVAQIGQQVKAHLLAEVLKQEATKTTAAVHQATLAESVAREVAAAIKQVAAWLQAMAAKMYAFYASLGPFGIPAAAATVAGVIMAVRAIKFQHGGMVPGQGYGDRVPALLEPGEFVVNRRATQQNRGALEAMNSGRGGFGGGNSVSIQLNLDGEGIPLGRRIEIRDLVEEMLPAAIERALDDRRFSVGYAR